MVERVFVDTSSFYALMIRSDEAHAHMVGALDTLRGGLSRWITTDYILDESATLLGARGHHSLAVELLDLVGKSRVLQVEWMNPTRFVRTRTLFAKYRDQGFSFTDCFSFVVMQELKIRKALTKDHHFDIMGCERL